MLFFIYLFYNMNKKKKLFFFFRFLPHLFPSFYYITQFILLFIIINNCLYLYYKVYLFYICLIFINYNNLNR